jgi:hypothetical protein
MTDFRALCEELVEELEVWIGYGDEADCADAHAVVDRARAALAEQPSLKEQALRELGYVYADEKIDGHAYDTIRNALEALPND